MSEVEYSSTVHHHRRTRRYKAEITSSDGHQMVSPPFFSEADAAAWADKYIELKVANLVQSARTPAPTPTATPHVTAAARPVQVHRQAQQVANLMGLPTPRSTGHCHYCGMDLVRGVCEDCG